MKTLAILLLSAALTPSIAGAEDVFIRVEAKRGADAARAAAAQWQNRVPDLGVATFALSETWQGIGLGPLPREQAQTRLEALKADRTVPRDAMLTSVDAVEEMVVLDGGLDQTGASSVTQGGGDAAAASTAASAAGIVATGPAGVETQQQPGDVPDAENAAVAEPEPAPDLRFIRLEAFQDRAEADAALIKSRSDIPETGLYELENGWFALAVGPMSPPTAEAWLKTLSRGDAVPNDSLIADAAEIGAPVDEGTVPDWPAPPKPRPGCPRSATCRPR